ncbi:hypothetical protein KCU91_g15220, partial [Aureobasidium melanogenum]
MPCRDETHEHEWPTEGTLHICRCEIFCGYCDAEDAKVVYNYPWHLRDHIRKVHARAQGLSVTVSPQPPKIHTSVKRKHAEMEKSDTNENEDEDEESEQNESSGSEYQGIQNKKGKGKAKIGSLARAPSDTFVADDTEDASPGTAPLHLRTKPAGKSKKSLMEGHAAFYKPVGPSSPKRPEQSTAMGPPPRVPMNNSTGTALMPHQQLYLQRMQDLARASSAHPSTNGSGLASHPQQVVNSGQSTAGNARLPAGTMGPPNGPLGPSPIPRHVPVPVPGQTYGRVNPATGQPMMSTHLPDQIPQPQPAIRDFYTSHPHLIAPAIGPPNHQRLRGLTTHMLTHANMTEQSVINHYQQEIEYIRSLQTTRLMTTFQEQMYGTIGQQMRQQFMQPPLELEVFFFRVVEHALMRYGLIPTPPLLQENEMPGGTQVGQQQGVQGRDMRQDQQHPGQTQRMEGGQHISQQPQRVVSGGQRSAPQPLMAQQVGSRESTQQNQTVLPGQQPSKVEGPAQAQP